MTSELDDTRIHNENAAICLVCQTPIESDEPKSLCSSCGKPYHTECWEQNKGCAVYGCSMVPPTEALDELEIPVSYWGKEKKTCPACGKEILAAALRCLHCGTIFSSARPVTEKEFKVESAAKEKKSMRQRKIIIIFILNILTFTAPLGVLIGLLWYRSHSKELKSLSHIYSTLARIGLGVGISQTVLMIIFGIFYSIFRV